MSRPRSGPAGRGGFTLIELMIASVVGALILMVMYQVLFLNQRSFTVQAEQIRQRQTLRASLDVLVTHLSEVSGEGGDLIAGGLDSVRIRSLTAFGIVCGGTPTGFRLERHGNRVEPRDSVLILAENAIFDPLDDRWLASQATAVDTTALCPTGQPAYDIEVPGIRIGPAVRLGAPVRAFEHRTFRLSPLGGEWFLARSGTSGPEPLVGPLAPPAAGGLTFEYRDSLDVPVADPRAADQIVITVRSTSQVRGLDGSPMGDSARARVSLKN